MDHQTSLNDLPLENKLNIFSRLPFDSVLDCRMVCKPWRNVLQNDNYFADLHLQYQRGLIQPPLDSDPGISHDGSEFSNMSFVAFDGKELYHVQNNGFGDFVYYDSGEAKTIKLRLPADVCGFVGSCNGLICLSVEMEYHLELYDYPAVNADPLYICNPITQELVTLPPHPNKGVISLVNGFGYSPSTNEYKVVRISYHEVSEDPCRSKGMVEVYTVGKGSRWSYVGDIFYLIVPNVENGNNCVNGCLHWLKYETGEIVAFDLADEKFHMVPTPPGLSSDGHEALSSRIFVTRGCLCLSCEYENRGDLWMLKKQENAVTSEFHRAKDQYYKSRKWMKELEIPYANLNHDLRIIGLTKEGAALLKEQGGCMLQCHEKYYGKVSDCSFRDLNHLISHINSFVSLKALGEVTVDAFLGSTRKRKRTTSF